MTAAPQTPNDVAMHLARLARKLVTLTEQINAADRDAVEKRGAHSLASARAFMAATGSVDARKHTATQETYQQWLDAEVADAIVRGLRRDIDSVKVRIDVGRSMNAAIRAELSLAGVHET